MMTDRELRQEQRAYSLAECARVIGKTESAVRNMVARKQLPTVKVGYRLFVLRDDVDRFLHSQLIV